MTHHAAPLIAALGLLGPGCFTVLGIEDTCRQSEPGCSPRDGGGDEPDGPAVTCDLVAEDLTAVCPGQPLPVQLGGGTFVFDTDMEMFVDGPVPPSFIGCRHTPPGGTEIYVMSVTQLNVLDGATLRAQGSHPLVVVATGQIDILGTVDASSRREPAFDPDLGAGANPAVCGDLMLQNGRRPANGQPSSGGGGGGFGAAGGSGGDELRATGPSGLGGDGGAAVALTAIRGGCRGGDGADPGKGVGGGGGGAVHLIAGGRLRVTGTVHAGGAGGGGGGTMQSGSGGGGGGSGGYIGLGGVTLEFGSSARVIANGGGGGEGGSSSIGEPGEDAKPMADAALGGTGGSTAASDGGAGGFAESPEGGAVTGAFMMPAGGGGGGGGVGHVVVFGSPAQALDGTFSPAPARCPLD